MTMKTINNIPCELKTTLKIDTLEVSIIGDWVLEAETPDLAILLAHLGEGSKITRLVFSTMALGRWDSLLMTELINLIDYGAKQGIQVDTATLPSGIQGLLSLVYAVPERVGARRQEVKTHWLEYI